MAYDVNEIEFMQRVFLSRRRRHTISLRDWSSHVCSSDLGARHPAGLLSPGPGRKGGIENVDVDGHVGRPGADHPDRPLEHRRDPELPHVVHEEAGDPALLLPGELLRAGPVAAQADLDVAL